MRKVCLLLLLWSAIGFAQNWTLNVMVDPNPSPYIGDWEVNPTMGFLELNYQGNEADVVIIYAEVRDGNGTVGFRGNSGRLLVNPGDLLQLNATQLRDWYTTHVNSEWERQVTRTGMIPEGDYEVRLWVKNLWDQTLIDNVYEYFTIRHPEPPEIVYPDNEPVTLHYPVFQWLPVQTPSGVPFYYHLRIVELLPGQTPQMALDANYPQYENSLITDSNFEYPLDALPLENNTTYIWQVRAITADGLSATKNDGRSEIGTFSTEFDASLPDLQLIEPADGDMITTPYPTFRWMEPMVTSGDYIYYTLRIARIRSGQDAETALAVNPPIYVNAATLTESSLTYPEGETELVAGMSYAWQVEARNAFGDPLVADEGKSQAWSFSVSHTVEDEDVLAGILPETLPLLGESVACLRLRDDQQVFVNFSLSSDSSQIRLDGQMLLSLPELAPETVTDPITSQGHLVFNRHTLEIVDGSLSASPGAAESSVLNLNPQGLPFVLQSLSYDAHQPGTIRCQAVPYLFDHLLTDYPAQLQLNSDGRLTGHISLAPDQTFALIPDSDLFKLTITSCYGSIDFRPGTLWQDELVLEGDLTFATETSTLHHAAELTLNRQGTRLRSFVSDPGSVRYTLSDVVLELADMQCGQLQYRNDLQHWMFDFVFDLGLHFEGLGISVPMVDGVHMGRFGVELPQISINDLNIASFFPYQGVNIRPTAFRMYSFTFDIFHAQPSDLERVGLFFDLDIILPGLPSHMAELNAVPFRANNAQYTGGRFTGDWNVRTFDPPVFVPLKEQSSIGLSVTTVQGHFPETTDASQTFLNVGAVFVPGDRLPIDPAQPVIFFKDELKLSWEGLWDGTKSVPLTRPIDWGPGLEIMGSKQDLVLFAAENRQHAALDVTGSVTLPTFSGQSIRATGSGRFDVLEWQLLESSFATQEAFALGLPAGQPVLGLNCAAGARVDGQGLHIPTGTTVLSLNDNSQVTGELTEEMRISLPQWQIHSAQLEMQESFAFDISEFQGGRDGMTWRSRSLQNNPATDADHLFLPLPGAIRLVDDHVMAIGNAQAHLQLGNQNTTLYSTFSHDFKYALGKNQVVSGQVDFYVDGDSVAVLDSSGFHPGDYFGATLLAKVIALPDSNIAYIDFNENPHLTTLSESGLVTIKSPTDQPARVRFPALQYRAATIPTVKAQVDIRVNAATGMMESGTITPVGQPVLSLDSAGVALTIAALNYESNTWMATVQPILPQALASSTIRAVRVPIGTTGLGHFDQGYNEFASSPQDSVVLGPYLTVTLDGIRGVMGMASQTVSVSGDFVSSTFQHQQIHFTADLSPDSAAFDLKILNLELPIGCGSIELFQQDDLPRVNAPMNQPDLSLLLCGKLSLPDVSKGFVLTLPRIEISGNSIQDIQLDFEEEAQKLQLFGTDVLIEGLALEFPARDVFHLSMSGGLSLFGKSIPISGLSTQDDCSLKDTTLTTLSSPHEINKRLNVSNLEIRDGNLQIEGSIRLPDPLDSDSEHSFALSVAPQGEWLDDEGKTLDSKLLTLDLSGSHSPESIVLGTDEFNVNARVSALELGMTGTDLAEAEGVIGLTLDTFWPGNVVSGNDDSTVVTTTGRFEFNQEQWTDSWLISNDSPVDTVYTALDNDLFMNAASFSMADTAGFRMVFNASMELPLPPGIMTGKIELLDNQMGKELFTFGRLHTGQISLSGVTLELLDFHYVRNGTVSSREIEFSKTSASVTDRDIQTDLYLSFGANLSTSLPGFEAGVERFVVFKSDSLFNLLIKGANLWVGDYVHAGLDLLGAIEWADSGTRFRWLVGGHLDMDMGQIKGAAVVGEVSYRETVGVNGVVSNHPGFGLMLAVKTDVDLTPLPISIKGLGAGFFWNPSPEIRDLVAGHLGFTHDVNSEFQKILEENDDDMMTFWEIYLYGEAAIPDDYYLQAKALLTLATDRIRLDAKGWPADSSALSDVVDLSGWISAECAWRQDFSSFKHLAGHIELGGRPATNSKMILKLPNDNVVRVDFILLGTGRFAMSGYLKTTMYGNLTMESDFTFGNPGFVFSGSLSYGFDVWILYAEAGMDVTVFFKWEEPKTFGGYASLWVQGAVIDDWLAGFRGEMGAAIMGAPEFFLYGYAEITGTVLGVSKTVRVWAKWESDGGMSAGTGGDETLIQMIAKAEETADEIMNAVDNLRAEAGLTEILQSGGLTEKEIRQLVKMFNTGMGENYLTTWDQDYEAMGNAARKVLEDMDATAAENERERMGRFFNDLIATRESLFNDGIGGLVRDAEAVEPILDQMTSDLSARNTTFQTATEEMADEMATIDFALDTLLALSDDSFQGIRNTASISYTREGGVRSPDIVLDESAHEQNQKSMEQIQASFESWQPTVDDNVRKINLGRQSVYDAIGPQSSLSRLQETLNAPLIVDNSDAMTAMTELNTSFQTTYRLYGNIPAPWDADDVFTQLATIDPHKSTSITRRILSIGMMGVALDDLPTNEIDRYRATGNLFYRRVPQVLAKHYLQKADTLMLSFDRYYKHKQAGLDSLHQVFTSHTDLLWDKYARLSENLYALVREYDSYLSLLDSPGYANLKDSTQTWLNTLEKQFVYPITTTSASITATNGFEPALLSIDWNATRDHNISEVAVSYNGNPFQSAGHQLKIEREYMLKHGVSYWYENSSGAIVWPFTNEQQRRITITPRTRNLAGLAVSSRQLIAELSGKDWKYAGGNNTVTKTSRGKDMFRCHVDFPYRHQNMNNQTVYINHQTETLVVRWSLKPVYGLSTYAPEPVKHSVEILQGGQTVWGPTTFKTVEPLDQRRYQVVLEDLDLSPDTGEPYTVKITQRDIAGTRIAITDMENSPALYISTKPPLIRADHEKFQAAAGQPVRYKLYKARLKVQTPDGDLVSRFHSYADYEYKLAVGDEIPDSLGWRNLADSKLVSRLPENVYGGADVSYMTDTDYPYYYLDFGFEPYEHPLTLWLRARHVESGWDTGYSDPVTFAIPAEKEYDDPTPAEFSVVGFDAKGNLQIEVTSSGSDRKSGVSHYTWLIHQDADEYHYAVNTMQPDSNHFAPEAVKPGVALSLRIPKEIKERLRRFELRLITVDKSGNQSHTSQTIKLPPPTPKLMAELKEGMHPYGLSLHIPLMPLRRQFVETLLIRVGTSPDASDAGVDSVIVENYPYDHQKSLDRTVELPAEIIPGTTLYVSAMSRRRGLLSEPYRTRIDIYENMFRTAETDSAGYLVLPITGSAFGGHREASFEYAIGYHNTTNPNLPACRFSLQSWTPLPGIITDHVRPGTRLRLPFKAGDAYPGTLIGLRATGLDGETCTTLQTVDIVPPEPEIRATLESNESGNDFPTVIRARFGSELQSSAGNDGTARVLMKIGPRPGDDSVYRRSLNVMGDGGWGELSMSLSFRIANYERIAITSHSVTARGKTSRDSTVVWLDVPPMPVFEFVSFGYDPAGYPVIKPTLFGFDSARVAGYQYAFGAYDHPDYNLRPFPADLTPLDFTPDQWRIGDTIVLPEDILGLDADRFKIGIRVISTSGEVREWQRVTHVYTRPRVTAEFVNQGQQLRITGSVSPEAMSQMTRKRLNTRLMLDGTTIKSADFPIAGDGSFDQTVWIPSDAPACTSYELHCSFFNSRYNELSVSGITLQRPCDAFIGTLRVTADDRIEMDILHHAFNGNRPLTGYQFSVQSPDGQTVYRPFPGSGVMDFNPAEVIPDSRLVLPVTIYGLPDRVRVVLRGVNTDGHMHTVSKQLSVLPPRPRVTDLTVERFGRLLIQLDERSVDQKTDRVILFLSRGWGDHLASVSRSVEPDDPTLSVTARIRETDLETPLQLKIYSDGTNGFSKVSLYDVTLYEEGEGYRIEWQSRD